MHLACWIPKATDIHSEYVILFFYCSNGYVNARHSVAVFVHLLVLFDVY